MPHPTQHGKALAGRNPEALGGDDIVGVLCDDGTVIHANPLGCYFRKGQRVVLEQWDEGWVVVLVP